jgi:hypothetical protein
MHGSMRRREATNASRASTRRAAAEASRRPYMGALAATGYRPEAPLLLSRAAGVFAQVRLGAAGDDMRVPGKRPPGARSARRSRIAGCRSPIAKRPATVVTGLEPTCGRPQTAVCLTYVR